MGFEIIGGWQKYRLALKKTTLLIFLILFQGCATVISIPNWNKRNAPVFYSGTRCDLSFSLENDPNGWEPTYIIDLPFSFALDTLLLPVSLPFAAGISRWHNNFEFGSACYDGEDG